MKKKQMFKNMGWNVPGGNFPQNCPARYLKQILRNVIHNFKQRRVNMDQFSKLV